MDEYLSDLLEILCQPAAIGTTQSEIETAQQQMAGTEKYFHEVGKMFVH